MLLSYLIRICDDIGDYEKDRAAGKAPIRKGVLVAMGIFSALAILVAALMAKACLMIIPLLVILLQFLIKEPYRDVIKPLFVPTVVVTVVLSFFAPNFWMYVAVPILIIADVILIAYKRRRRGI